MAERLMTKEVFKGFVEGYYKPDLEKRDEALETAKTEIGKLKETKASIGETVETVEIEV